MEKAIIITCLVLGIIIFTFAMWCACKLASDYDDLSEGFWKEFIEDTED